MFKIGENINISFKNQKNLPLGPLDFKDVKYSKVGKDNFVDNLLFGNIGVLHGPGLIELILIL